MWVAAPRRRAAASALAFTALYPAPHPPPCCSPLKGTGIPRLETTKVYVSAYLDRLLKGTQRGRGSGRPPPPTPATPGPLWAACSWWHHQLWARACHTSQAKSNQNSYRHTNAVPAVNEDDYRWEAAIYFFVSWRDDSAFPTVAGEFSPLFIMHAIGV